MNLRKVLTTGLNVHTAKSVAKEACEDPSLFQELLTASFSREAPLCQIAAWTLRHLSLIDRHALIPFQALIAKQIEQPIDGVNRDLLFTLCEIVDFKSGKSKSGIS
jgi:hypothetical protein